MKEHDVPFIENPDDRCLVACVGMVLEHFMPERNYTMPELDELCGYVEGMGTWPIKHALELADMGFEIKWIEDFDFEAFADDPEGYLRTFLDPEALEWQLAHSNLPLEASRVREYLKRGMTIEKRKGTKQDIIDFINDGWLVRLEVNANTLKDEPGYDAHAVLAIDHDGDDFIIHNPDGSKNTPNQRVGWGLLQQARKEYGGIDSIMAYRKQKA